MVLTYLALFVVCIWKCKFTKNEFNKEYLAIKQTKAVQGVFTILVLLSHASTYIDFSDGNYLDKGFIFINGRISQLMVTMFLFYSGYGIMQRIKTDKSYIDSFFKNRFLPVWLKFAFSVCLFIIVNLALGTLTDYSPLDIALSFTAWTKLGNSNWFMFVTFLAYLLVLLCFKIFKNKKLSTSLNALFVLILAYILIFSLLTNKGAWWYNTILCFPLGMVFSLYIDKFEKIFFRFYWQTLVVLSACFMLLYLLQDRIPNAWGYCVLSCVFSLIVILITAKVKIGNPILSFFGNHIFSIYILQRIPYMIFQSLIENKYLFFTLSFVVTILLSVVFDYCFDKISKKELKKVEKTG